MLKINFKGLSGQEAWNAIVSNIKPNVGKLDYGFVREKDDTVTFYDGENLGYEDGYREDTTYYECAWITPYTEDNVLILGLHGNKEKALTNSGWIFYHQKMLELIMRKFLYTDFTLELFCEINNTYDLLGETRNIE